MKAGMKTIPLASAAGFAVLCLLTGGCRKSDEALAGRVQALESDVSRLESETKELKSRLEQVHTQVANASSRLSNVGEKVREVQNETAELRQPEEDLPYGIPAVGKNGQVYSPFAEDKGLVDVTGMKRGTRVQCPYTGRHFRVP